MQHHLAYLISSIARRVDSYYSPRSVENEEPHAGA